MLYSLSLQSDGDFLIKLGLSNGSRESDAEAAVLEEIVVDCSSYSGSGDLVIRLANLGPDITPKTSNANKSMKEGKSTEASAIGTKPDKWDQKRARHEPEVVPDSEDERESSKRVKSKS
ncbi:hypothetical protein VNI00_015868 [Paramarasmius palmivorus]|uniref:Uncharacterized protein n=1 Tax=Paramarasmius palmivorus TaxID=297713 RepID=A0AAW0BJ87_9AGAR